MAARTDGPPGPRVPAGRRARFAIAAALLAGVAGLATDRSAPRAAGPAPPTRADLAALRSRVALLESELALARTRKPYIVVDAAAKRLRYALLGMNLREIAARDITLDGLRSDGGKAAPSPALAGIVTLAEKEKDPRLVPLTPEQIEAGASDENVADVLPPEIPGDYDLTFKQPIVVRVEGVPDGGAVLTRAASFWRALWPGWGRGERALRVVVRLDESAAREVYRSLLPGERLIILAPPGRLLPDAGQEPPRSVRPGRAEKPPAAPQPGAPQPEGVPFRIPEPVADTPPDAGTPPNGGTAPDTPLDPGVEATTPAPPGEGPGPTPEPEESPEGSPEESPEEPPVPAETPAPGPPPT